MQEIICTTQKELDAAIKRKNCYIVIRDTKEWVSVSGNATIQSISVNATIKSVSNNAIIQYVSDNAIIKFVSDNATIKAVSGNATIQYVSNNAVIKSVFGNATIKYVSGNATIQSVFGKAMIKYIYGNAIIKSVFGNTTIQYVYGNATIMSVSGNETIKYVYGNAVIKSVSGSTTIQSISGNTTIQSVFGNVMIKSVHGDTTIKSVYGNATIQVFSPSVTILYTAMYAVIIMIGCVCKIKKRQKSVTVIKNKIAEYTKRDFLGIYSADKNGDITLYKVVRDNNTDFYTGKIKYEGTVTCPDWDSDNHRQCGGGLHLSPRPELALIYNQGKLLKCKVNKKDFVVFPNDITKVRCKKVTVIGEYTEGK